MDHCMTLRLHSKAIFSTITFQQSYHGCHWLKRLLFRMCRAIESGVRETQRTVWVSPHSSGPDPHKQPGERKPPRGVQDRLNIAATVSPDLPILWNTRMCACARTHKRILTRKTAESPLVLLIKLNEVRLHYQRWWEQVAFIKLGHIKSKIEKFKPEGQLKAKRKFSIYCIRNASMWNTWKQYK